MITRISDQTVYQDLSVNNSKTGINRPVNSSDKTDAVKKSDGFGGNSRDMSTACDENKCTVNTDKVDREIEGLKKEKIEIENQLKDAAVDENNRKMLEEKLARVEAELKQKDNDTYRKQHATYRENYI